MLINKLKFWQLMLLIPAMLAISGQIVLAQSSSASYKAVDFVNPEASLSSSNSYQLNDSVDYYGGIHSSAGYTECTGDFAVLSNCGQLVVTPPTQPTPPNPPGGGGGGGCTSGCSGAGDVETFGKPPSSNPPVGEPPTPVIPKKPFVLPNIKEPIPQPVEPIVVKPVEVKEVIKDISSKDVAALIKNVESEVVNIIAPKLNCEDLVCLESNLLRPAAKKAQPAICKVYSFGGFGFDIDCQNLLMIWLVLGLSAMFVMPFGFHVYRKKNLK
ncbi:hypothetical protein IT412_03030 [Candidatus Peregrinibacteria bacterium]|nr:hypothetical protein [Candidatus Peregrinibacteria bacterium]